MASWFEEIIHPEDRYEVAKAKLEINITLKHLRAWLTGFIDRVEKIG